MKTLFYKSRLIPTLGLALSLIFMLASCEQKDYEPTMNAAPGGGTVTTYKAYTLVTTDPQGKNIYGRVVFYKYNTSITLVQMGLYNTVGGTSYAASIYQGKVAGGTATVLKPLDAVSGATGEFVNNKYFTINEAGFYDKLDAYSANVKVMTGTTPVATGDIGSNAAPIAKAD